MYKINELPTPCFVIDEGKLEENLKILHQAEERTGAKILLAQKCFSCFSEYPLIGKYILHRNRMSAQVHRLPP